MSQIKMPPPRVKASEQMITKFKFRRSITAAKQKIYYIGERSHEGYEHPDEKYFDALSDDADKYKLIHFIENSKIAQNQKLASHYDIVFSVPAEMYKDPSQYYQAVRSTMEYMSKEKGVHLHWVAGVHDPIHDINDKNKGSRTQPHVHLIIASEGEYRRDNRDPDREEWKKTGYVKFSKEDIAKMTNHMKMEMGMDYVMPEKALENEKRIQDEWKMQSLERKIAYEFGLAEQRINMQRTQMVRTPLDFMKQLGIGGADNSPTSRSTEVSNTHSNDGGIEL